MAEKENTQIAIPVTGRVLAEFISDLLGERRSTERVFRGYQFNIDFGWLTNLHKIIDQRVTAQNAGNLADFAASLYFDSGRVQNIFTWAAFDAYHDFSSEICLGVELKWVYLIQFPQKTLPEKQEINFLIAVDQQYKERRTPNKFSFFDSVTIGPNNDSIVRIVVSYSDFTWGEDIVSHVARPNRFQPQQARHACQIHRGPHQQNRHTAHNFFNTTYRF